MLGIAKQSRTTSRCVSSRTRSIDIERKKRIYLLESRKIDYSKLNSYWSMERVLDKKPMVSSNNVVGLSFIKGSRMIIGYVESSVLAIYIHDFLRELL